MDEKTSLAAFCRRAATDAAASVTVGFTLVMLLFGALVHWAGIGTMVEGNILGFGFQLSTAVFFALCGFLRSLKYIPNLNATFYRLLHFLCACGLLYVCYFALWPQLSVALGEQKEDSLASGAVNWAHIILAYVIFFAAYFAVIGIRAARASRKERRAIEAGEYESMLKKKAKK